MSFLLDTNVFSETMKRQPDPKVDAWVFQQKTITLSIISVEEIYFGLLCKDANKKLAWFDNFLQLRAEVLPITPEIAKSGGAPRTRFRQQGISRS